MIAENLTYRNFLNQTGDFNTDWVISINNIIGSGKFGISGNGNIYAYTIKSGELYDPYNNLLGSYAINNPFTIKNEIINSKDTLYYNNNPKFFFKTSNFFGTHNYNYFFVDPSGLIVDFNFFIRGEATTLQISGLNNRVKNDNTNEIINYVTGRIINNKPELNVKIFDGYISNNPEFTLSGLPLSFYDTGYFYIITDSGATQFYNSSLILPITFNTNYGPISFDFNFKNQYIPLQFSSLTIDPTENVNIFNNQISKFFVNYGSSSGSYLNIQLNYISGTTGFFTGNIFGTGYVTDTISGIITGSGYIEKTLDTSVVLTGYNPYGEVNDSIGVTGVTIREFVYATGNVYLDYTITGTGLGTGYVYLDVPSSGAITVSVSGYVPYLGGGQLFYTTGGFLSTGYSVDMDNNPVEITGFSNTVTNYLTVLYTGDISGVYLTNSQYFLKTFSGSHLESMAGLIITGQPYYQLATGYGTGINKTGIVDPDFFRFFEGGNYFFTKLTTGVSGFFSLSDEGLIITGLSGLLRCNSDLKKFKYLGVGLVSGINRYSEFLDYCDDDPILFDFVVTGKPTRGYQLYESGEDKTINEEEDIPKFIIIGVTGEVESSLTHLENIEYLTGNIHGTGIRTRISHIGNTISGSGYFSGIFSEAGCADAGIWEHNFIDYTSNTTNYYTNNYISSNSIQIISFEDNITDNFNYIKFNIL
jgi:hypothetical protein